MLDFAINHKEELIRKSREYWNNDKYKFANNSSYNSDIEISNGTWNHIQMVSLNANNKVAGYISVDIDRDSNKHEGLVIINYDNNKIIFGKDVYNFLNILFQRKDFRKLTFTAYTKNPISKTYNKIIKLHGGRIVGEYKKHDKLIDGEYYDLKMYEITKDDLIKSGYYNKFII